MSNGVRSTLVVEKVLGLFCLAFLLAYSSAQFLYADSFKILGTRALGMGGAYVAIGEDAITQYWNPAGLGIGRDVDLQIPVGVSAEATGNILESADKLHKIADQFNQIQAAQKYGKSISLDQIAAFAQGINELNNLNGGKKGILIDAGAGANLRVSHFAFSVNNFTSFGTDPSVDINNLGLGKSSPGLLSPGLSKGVDNSGNSGVDLGSLITDQGVAYKNTTDPTLQASANTLTATIQVLIDKSGVNTGGYNAQDLANAIVNAATDPTVAAKLGITPLSAQNVKDDVTQINALKPLLNSLLSGTTGSAYSNNQSNLTGRGASVVEASLGYGFKVPYVQSDDVLGGFFKGLYAGANIKYMQAYVGYDKVKVLSNDNSNPFSNLGSNNYKTSDAIGADVGLLLKKDDFLIFKRTQFGLLVRNINSPQFDQPAAAIADGEGSKYTLNPQARGGIAIFPFNWWSISSDLDLTKNSTPLPNYYSKLWGLGNEFNIVHSKWLNLALRAGLMRNIAESTAKLAYTGGFGITLLHVVIDVGAAMSTDRVEVSESDSGKVTKIPSAGAAAATVSFVF